ncbi:hypothetical protein [Providencia alcalifaciens]
MKAKYAIVGLLSLISFASLSANGGFSANGVNYNSGGFIGEPTCNNSGTS